VSCDYTHTALHGYLDGELDASRSAEFERHLEGCRECAKALETQESLRSILRRSGLCESAPNSLRKKIRAELDARTSVPITERIPVWRWAAVAASIVLVAAISWYAWPGSGSATRNPAAPPFTAAELIDAHIRSLQPGHLTDVASTDQHTVKPWFNGKLDVSPPVIDLTAQGFTLIGGRLDYLDARAIGAVVYRRRQHIINLFVAQTPNIERRAAKTETIQGFNIRRWSDRGLNYWAISDLGADELDEFGEKIEAAARSNTEG